MKKLSELIEKQKLQYETTINMDVSKFEDSLRTMSNEEKNEYLHLLEEEKQTASEKLNNPNQIEEDIKKEVIFNAIKFVESMKYVRENSVDLNELINKAPKFWISSSDLSKPEKLILLGYGLGQATFEFDEKDYKECGGLMSPDFLKNLVRKINSEYNVTIPLTDEWLTINGEVSKRR